MKIFKISVLSIPYDFKYGDHLCVSLPFELIEYHSSFEKAKNELDNFLKNLPSDERKDYIRFSIDEILVDTPNHWNSFIYDNELNLLENLNPEKTDSIFLGINKNDEQYSVGDWVEFIYNDHLEVGQILHTPFTVEEVKEKKYTNLDYYDNCYYIIFGCATEKDPNPHSHAIKINIVGKSLRSKIPSAEKESIENRFNKFK